MWVDLILPLRLMRLMMLELLGFGKRAALCYVLFVFVCRGRVPERKNIEKMCTLVISGFLGVTVV